MKRYITLITLLLTGVSGIWAQPVADSLKKLLARETQPARRANLLMQLSEDYRVSNPDSCYAYAQQALATPAAASDRILYAHAQINSASFFFFTGKPEQAIHLLDSTLSDLPKKLPDHTYTAQYHSIYGLCLMKLDRKKEALERFYAALKIAEKINDYTTQVRASNNIGWAMMELNQYEQAIASFRNCVKLIEEQQMIRLKSTGVIYNNMASCFGALSKLDSAKKYAQLGIRFSAANGDFSGQANGYFILGTAFEKEGDLAGAMDNFQLAQPLREKTGDPYYIVSDLAEIASLYSRMGMPDKGIEAANKAIKLATENNIEAKLPMIYTALAANYEKQGAFEEAAKIYKKLNDLKDSIYTDANPKALAEMQARYETEKKEQQILLQRSQLDLQQSELVRKNITLIAIAVLVALATLLVYSMYRRYRLKQKAMIQAEILRHQELATKAVLEAEERERQRIAKDLHDGVGQIMSAAKMNLSSFEHELQFGSPEQQQKFQRIISLVDESCKEVRSVSHNMMPNALLKSGLAAAIREFTDKIDDKVLRVNLYAEGLDQRLDTNLETVLYRVVQECVNNVLKHSGASHLDISLIRDTDGISATIEDNGRGFDAADPHKKEGLGLKNIRTRVEYLKGTVEFNSRPGKGTLVAIHVPAIEMAQLN